MCQIPEIARGGVSNMTAGDSEWEAVGGGWGCPGAESALGHTGDKKEVRVQCQPMA